VRWGARPDVVSPGRRGGDAHPFFVSAALCRRARSNRHTPTNGAPGRHVKARGPTRRFRKGAEGAHRRRVTVKDRKGHCSESAHVGAVRPPSPGGRMVEESGASLKPLPSRAPCGRLGPFSTARRSRAGAARGRLRKLWLGAGQLDGEGHGAPFDSHKLVHRLAARCLARRTRPGRPFVQPALQDADASGARPRRRSSPAARTKRERLVGRSLQRSIVGARACLPIAGFAERSRAARLTGRACSTVVLRRSGRGTARPSAAASALSRRPAVRAACKAASVDVHEHLCATKAPSPATPTARRAGRPRNPGRSCVGSEDLMLR